LANFLTSVEPESTCEFEVDGGIYENNNIQKMAMHLGNITNIPRIDYVHYAF